MVASCESSGPNRWVSASQCGAGHLKTDFLIEDGLLIGKQCAQTVYPQESVIGSIRTPPQAIQASVCRRLNLLDMIVNV